VSIESTKGINMIVGITGLMGCGKSYIGSCFQTLGVDVMDCDNIAHEVMAINMDIKLAIKEICPNCIFEINGVIHLNRKELSAFVLNHPDAKTILKQLSDITQPAIIRETKIVQFDYRLKNKHLIMLVPLLFECNMQEWFNKTVYVYTDHEKRMERLMTKRGFVKPEHIKIFDDVQIPPEKKFIMCDYVVLNNTDDNVLETVKTLCNKML
jgi:dephospho-CoA kinase